MAKKPSKSAFKPKSTSKGGVGSNVTKNGGLIKKGGGKAGKGLPSVSHGKTRAVGRPKQV